MNEQRNLHRDRFSWYLYDFGNTAIEFTIALHLTQWFIADLGISSIVFGVAFAGSSWLVGLTAPFAGSWADLRNRRRPWFLAASLAAAAAVGSLSVLPSNGHQAARVLLTTAAIGNYFFHLAGTFYNAGLRRASSGANLGTTSAVGTALSYLGGLATIPTVAFVTTHGNWGLHADRSRFFLPAAVLFVIAAIPALTNKRLWDAGNTSNQTWTRGWLARPWQLASSHRTRAFLIGYFLLNSAIIGVSLYLPVYIRSIPSVTEDQVGGLIACAVLCAIVGALVASVVAKSLMSARRLIMGAQLLWALSLALSWLLPPSVTIEMIFTQAFFAGILIPSLRAIFAMMFAEHDQATAFGLFGFVQRISAGFGALLWPVLQLRGNTSGTGTTAMAFIALVAVAAIPFLVHAAASERLARLRD